MVLLCDSDDEPIAIQTFDRIEKSSLQLARANLPFNEIVLCALMNRQSVRFWPSQV